MTEPTVAARPWPALSLAEADALMTAPGAPFEMQTRRIGGVVLRTWKNGPQTFRDTFLLARSFGPERTFLVFEEERVDFEAFARAAITLAHDLIANGVVKGDRVALAMRNLPEWPVAFFGAILAGAIVTPLNAWWTGSELAYGLIDSGAKVAILDSQRLQRLGEHLADCPDLERIYVARELEEVAHPRVIKLEKVIGAPTSWRDLPDRPMPDVAIDPEDDATIFYTSGTTGNPKGALGTHRAGATNVLCLAYSQARAFVRRGETPPAPDPAAPQQRGLVSIPFFHVTGCMALLCPAMAMGAMLVMLRKWDAEQAMAVIERERITRAGGVPTIAWQLLEHPARDKYDLSSLQSISYGGAPAAPELVRRMRELFPNSLPGTGWGMTETSATFTHHSGEDYQNRPDSCGPALPIGDLKVVGANGAALPPGQVGELMARGPNVVKAYWNKPEASAKTFQDGWVLTGDLARLDEEGFCYIVDRAKDMIIRGGENIYSAEVEAVLYEHPDVLDAALVPIPHRTLGEEPGAVVTLRAESNAGEKDLQGFVAERLAAFKVPVRILFAPDLLPRNANGKILKGELKKLFV